MTANSTEADTGQRLKKLEDALYNLQRERRDSGSTLDNCPTGMVAGFLSANPPEGWLLIDGQTVTLAGHPALYAYLTANGFSTTLPDLADRFVVGAGNLYTSTSTGGSASHTITEAELPAHRSNAESAGFGLTASASFTDRVFVSDTADPFSILPPYRGLYWMIRT